MLQGTCNVLACSIFPSCKLVEVDWLAESPLLLILFAGYASVEVIGNAKCRSREITVESESIQGINSDRVCCQKETSFFLDGGELD